MIVHIFLELNSLQMNQHHKIYRLELFNNNKKKLETFILFLKKSTNLTNICFSIKTVNHQMIYILNYLLIQRLHIWKRDT
jgi:hypothetical protein